MFDTPGDVVGAIAEHAHTYSKRVQESLKRNNHMHNLKECEVTALSDEQCRAVLNDFINYYAAKAYGMDYAMNTGDFPPRSALHGLAECAPEDE